MKRLVKLSLGIIFLVVIYTIVLTVEWRNLQLTEVYVKQFTPISELNTFVETSPKINLGIKKIPHAVLLLHGWSATPQEFQALTAQLKRQNISYYVPQLTGFGLGDMHLLRTIKGSDWLRDAIYGYDLLAAVADEVSVIGHSNGGVLAVLVAQRRPVKHLILSAPYLAVSKSDKIYKTALNTPVVAQIIEFFLPVFAKPVRSADSLNKLAPEETFRYPTLPIKSLVALWTLQDKANIDKANFQDLTVLYGKYDQDVNISAVLAAFEKENIPFKTIEYTNSGHNIFQGEEKMKVVNDITHLLEK